MESEIKQVIANGTGFLLLFKVTLIQKNVLRISLPNEKFTLFLYKDVNKMIVKQRLLTYWFKSKTSARKNHLRICLPGQLEAQKKDEYNRRYTGFG